jgi:hypothetical protein
MNPLTTLPFVQLSAVTIYLLAGTLTHKAILGQKFWPAGRFVIVLWWPVVLTILASRSLWRNLRPSRTAE